MSVFRELFVELPKAILEEALRRHLPKDEPKLNVTAAASPPLDYWDRMIRYLIEARGFGWSLYETRRDERFDRIHVLVQMPCQHIGRFSIDESDLHLYGRPIDVFDTIAEVLEGTPRRKCYCVQYEPPVPCTAGVCQ